MDKIAVGAMKLHSVEASLDCVYYTLFELFFGCFDIFQTHLFRHREIVTWHISYRFSYCQR